VVAECQQQGSRVSLSLAFSLRVGRERERDGAWVCAKQEGARGGLSLSIKIPLTHTLSLTRERERERERAREDSDGAVSWLGASASAEDGGGSRPKESGGVVGCVGKREGAGSAGFGGEDEAGMQNEAGG